MRKLTVVVAVLALFAGMAGARADKVPAALKQGIRRLLNGLQADKVRPTPVAGLWEVTIGPHVVYMTADGRYLLRGDLIEVANHHDLTESGRRAARLAAVERVGEKNMIVFGPRDAKHTLNVFTDVTCPYCRLLDNEVPQLNAAGIKVRYLAFPRAGIPSAGYDEMVAVWCASDPRKAFSDAKAGRAVPPRKCDNPVREEYQLGQVLGVNGTPTLILDDGELIPGYLPAADLIERFREGG